MMSIEEVLQVSQSINSKLQKMCETGLKEENRAGIAEEVRGFVTRLCLSVIEGQQIMQTQASQSMQPQREVDVPDWL